MAELGPRNSIPGDTEDSVCERYQLERTKYEFVRSSATTPPPSAISTGYSSKPYSGNNQSRRGRGKVLSNLISSRATSSDFLPVTLRFLPDQQETTGGD